MSHNLGPAPIQEEMGSVNWKGWFFKITEKIKEISDGDITYVTDTISEETAGAGVTVDGVLLKDGEVTTDVINEETGGSGVTVDSVLLKDGSVTAPNGSVVKTNTINETTGGAGVTIDGLRLQDGGIDEDLVVNGNISDDIMATDTVDGRDTLILTDTDGTSTRGPVLDLFRNSSSPADSDAIGRIEFNGENSASEKTKFASIQTRMADVTNGTEDGILEVLVMQGGAHITFCSIDADGLYTVNATGGGQGVETSNWKGVYDDGSGPLTHYVVDQFVDGEIDYSFYDGTLFGGEHAREWDTNDLDINCFGNKVKCRKALPAFPTKEEMFDSEGKEIRISHGDYIQKLVETVEVLTTHIITLNDRIEVLEDKLTDDGK